MRARNWLSHRLFVVLFLLSFHLAGQDDHVGAGRCLVLDGENDFVDLGNIYDSLIVPITISAWIYLDNSNDHLSPIFVRQDPEDNHDELIFFVTTTQLVIGYGNGVVASDIPVFRRSKGASLMGISGRWIHVTGIINEERDMELFVNGINVGGAYAGNSSLPIVMSGHDQTKIGYWFSGTVNRFKGKIDEVQVWNRELTGVEIRNNMCRKLTGREPGLVGYWTFDETAGIAVHDQSPNGYDGVIFGDPGRPFSGAPIGDESVSIYPPSWEELDLSLVEEAETFLISNIRGNPEGIFLYVVRDLPSQREGLNLSRVNKPYFGVFVASLDMDNQFDVDILINGVPSAEAAERVDNSYSRWTDAILSARNISQRGEFIRQCPRSNIDLELGPDKILCDQSTFQIDSGNDPLVNPIQWSTGETSAAISVDQSGMYWAIVGKCDAKMDSVRISFYETPKTVSLGDDIVECALVPKTLDPSVGAGFEFIWQDGSKNATYEATDFGTYWVTVYNSCGMVSDTLRIHQPVVDFNKIPNIITPNGDPKNEYLELEENLKGQVMMKVFNRWGEEVCHFNHYDNSWNAQDLSDGVYYLQLSGDCINYSGSLTIVR